MATAKELLTNLANSIRAKATGSESGDALSLAQMKDMVDGIVTTSSLPELSNPATAEHILSGKQAYTDSGYQIVGTMTDYSDVDYFSSTASNMGNGLGGIYVTVENRHKSLNGYVNGVTAELNVGNIVYSVLDGDSNYLSSILTGENPYLSVGKTMLGGAVQGTFTSDATASPSQILDGATAYVSGQKIEGTIPYKTASDLTASSNKVNVPSGYYQTDVSKEVEDADISLKLYRYSADRTYVLASGSEGYIDALGIDNLVLEIPLQKKSVTPLASAQTISPDANYYGLSSVTVSAVPTEKGSTSPSTSAKTIKPSSGKFFSEFTVNAAPLQSDEVVTPSKSVQTITPASGYYGLSKVVVNAMPTATQATPSISLDTDTGLITATSEQSAGYVDAGRTSAPYQLPTRGERLITPGVNPIGILAGQYLTGDQTIAGSVYLVPENIKKGVSIFGVAGTYTGSSSPSDFTPSSGATVNVRPSGTLDGTSLWCNYAITPVGYSSDYAIFEYTLTAGTSSTTGSSAAGNEEYSALIRFSGTNIEERTYCVIVKSWNTAWNKGSTAARFTESGFFAVPITGVPSSVTVLSRFKTTAVSNVVSATGTVTF